MPDRAHPTYTEPVLPTSHDKPRTTRTVPRNARDSVGLVNNVTSTGATRAIEEGPKVIDYTAYNPQYEIADFETMILSHDRRLNEDGEALCRFILSQSKPSYLLHCRGSHSETRTQSGPGGGTSTTTVTDFDFFIDLSNYVLPSGTLWTAHDMEPEYRGMTYREVGSILRQATKKELDAFKQWKRIRELRGLPPWIGSDRVTSDRLPMLQWPVDYTLRSAQTLRQWAGDYCASDKLVKEFVFRRSVYGWNIEELGAAIRDAIRNSPYNKDVEVSFETRLGNVVVRPDSGLSRALSNPWIRIPLKVSLVYPFIWLFKRHHRRGGARWTVAGEGYAVKRWEQVDDKALPKSGQIYNTDAGVRRLVGTEEEFLFNTWKDTISRLVLQGERRTTPVTEPDPQPWHELIK